jgi:parvulin-like peptidyl-prolyl isomerase
VLGVALSLGLIVWQVKAGRAGAVNLTSDDMALIAQEQQPQMQSRLASDEAYRKDFAKNLREVFAVAEEARLKGFADKPELKRQLDLVRALVISQNYTSPRGNGPGNGPGSPPSAPGRQQISDADIDAVYKDPAREAQFQQFIKDAQAHNPTLSGQPIPDDQMKQIRHQLGQVMVGEQRGIAAGLDRTRKVELQILMEQARVLASAYADENLIKQTKATDAEIDDYIKKHPELDTTQARAKAEDVLKRARGGEDFAKLATEFSGDPGSKDKGGDLGWFGRGQMVAQFDMAAFALQPGQISDIVETEFGFHIIKLLERRTGTKDGKPEEQVHASHILIAAGAPNPFGPPKAPRDQAREAVEQEKEKKVLDEIVSHSHVVVADNYKVAKPPDMPSMVPNPQPQAPPASSSDQPGQSAKPATSPKASSGKR